MKSRIILMAIGAALLIGWLGWSPANRNSLPDEQKRDSIAEAEYCASLKSADPGKRTQAYLKLRELWERDYWRMPRYGTASEPDELIRSAMEALKSETDRNAAIVGGSVLSVAPPSRVQFSWIEDVLKEVAAKSPDDWIKCHTIGSVIDLYYRQGMAPSGAAMAMIDEWLRSCHDPQALYHFLIGVQNMYSDLRPLEKTLQLLLQYPSRAVSEAAKRALDDMNLPITSEDRRDRTRTFAR